MNTEIDIICVGEVLIDYIGNEINTLENTTNFTPYLGGSPTNVAVNAAKLGLNTVLVSTCGKDKFANFILDELQRAKVNTAHIAQTDSPTSLIYISRSLETPEFKAVRSADFEILESQIPDELLANAKIFHTTCFGLSQNPARTTILNSAKKAAAMGLLLSIDINYSSKVWDDSIDVHTVLNQYLIYNPIVKVSNDDCLRLFNVPKTDQEIFDYFHNLGVETVCLTQGEHGVKVSDTKEGVLFAKAHKIDYIKDSTGAGDAFWTGFLYSKLQGNGLQKCMELGQKLAAIKLQNVGGLPDKFDF